MITIIEKNKCCGCTACASICTQNAITMKPDALGFLYPEVNKSKCTDCGLCEKVCSFHDNYDKSFNLSQPEAYAARHKNMQEVETSRSGAAFIAISDYILEKGGVVYGAGYTDYFRVIHKRAVNKEERNEFKGSKYVQSDLTGIFHQIKEDLKNKKIVLFSGTPCQTSGLKSYVSKKLQNNLFLVDIVCHGVPAPYIWRDYLAYITNTYGQNIVKVNFRDKRIGWKDHKESFELSDGRLLLKRDYTHLYYQHIMLRESCSVCPFCNITRPSDITIADFWGWEKTDTQINADNKGVSLLFCNTEKGRELFKLINKELIYIPAILENCMQGHLRYPTAMHPNRIKFENDYVINGFMYVMKRYGDMERLNSFKKFCKTIIHKIIK